MEPSHSLFIIHNENDIIKAPLANCRCQGGLPGAMATAPPAIVPPVAVPQIALPRPPTWEELFSSTDRALSPPMVPYTVLSAAIFNSANPPEVLLNKLEHTALESPVILTLVSNEDPSWVTLLKNLQCFVGNLLHPTALDGLFYGFLGPDA